MPSGVLHHLQKGSFSVRLSPTEWHGVALDRCHEMRINKDAKLAVIHPSKHKMEFLSNYMCFRSSYVENFKNISRTGSILIKTKREMQTSQV
jgi:hypothetical protein